MRKSKNGRNERSPFRECSTRIFFGVRTLSDGDIAYITAIMRAMPQSVSELHFPVVVLPDREMISYLAVRSGNEVKIREETVTIAAKGE